MQILLGPSDPPMGALFSFQGSPIMREIHMLGNLIFFLTEWDPLEKGEKKKKKPDKNKIMDMINVIWPRHVKMCYLAYADSEGLDQPAHPCSLISAFTVRMYGMI